eukprot:tig00021071_g17955.t1
MSTGKGPAGASGSGSTASPNSKRGAGVAAAGAGPSSPPSAHALALARPSFDGRPAKVQLPTFISIGRDPSRAFRPSCARCGLESVTPPAYLLPCAAARVLARSGASSLGEALETHPSPTLEDLRGGASSSFVCLTCALTLVSGAVPDRHRDPWPPAANADAGSTSNLNPKPTTTTTEDAPAHARRSFTCPACKEGHRAPEDLLTSSRIDAYLAYMSFIEEGAGSAQSWISSEIVARQALVSVCERVAQLELELQHAHAQQTLSSGSAGADRDPPTHAPASEASGEPKGADPEVPPKEADATASTSVASASSAHAGDCKLKAAASSDPDRAGPGSSAWKGKAPVTRSPANPNSTADPAAAAAPALPADSSGSAASAAGKDPAADPDDGRAAAAAAATERLRKRKKPDSDAAAAVASSSNSGPSAASSSSRSRSRSATGPGAVGPGPRRKPYESDKLVKILYCAYTHPAENPEASGSEEEAGPPAASAAGAADQGAEASTDPKGAAAAPAAAALQLAGPVASSSGGGKRGARGADKGARSDADASDSPSASNSNPGSGSDSRAGSPDHDVDPREAELAAAWEAALATAAEGPQGDEDELEGGLEGAAAGEDSKVDPESLPAYEMGLSAGVDIALVGRRLDGNAEARAELLERVQQLGRDRIRAIMLVAAAVLGAYEKYRDQHGNNRKLWGYWRKTHVESKYNSILGT